jgi:hypothetical protein
VAHDGLDAEATLGRFNTLMRELLDGETRRNCFNPWEVELLLDIAACKLEPRRARDTLRRYQKAAERRLDYGILPPLKLSEYLEGQAVQPAGLVSETRH